MPDRVLIGGREFALEKDEYAFNLLFPEPSALAKLSASDQVAAISNVANGIWKVNVRESRHRDRLMDVVRLGGIAHHAYRVTNDDLQSLLVLTDEINVVPAGDDATVVDEICREMKLIKRGELPGGVHRLRVTNETNRNPLKCLAELADDARLVLTEPDFVPNLERQVNANQWHLHGKLARIGQDGLASVRAVKAWDITMGSPDVVVAILDDGFDLTLPDLAPEFVWPSDFVGSDVEAAPLGPVQPDDDKPLADASRGDFHGTPCAALAVGRGANAVWGTAPMCSWMPIRFRIGGISQNFLLGIIAYASEHADVLSCSWGLKPSGFVQFSETASRTVAELAATGGRNKNGLVMCFAAGNYNLPTYLPAAENARGFEYYDRSGNVLGHFFKNKDVHGGWTEVPGIVVVGSVSARGRKSLYSDWGKHLTVVAPSDNWHPRRITTRPHYASVNLTTCDNDDVGIGLRDAGLSDVDLGSVTNDMGGTSGATPIVAGICGLIKSILPKASAADVLQILRDSCNKADLDPTLDEPAMYNNEGQDGSFDSTGHSLWFGYGLVDAARACEIAASKREN